MFELWVRIATPLVATHPAMLIGPQQRTVEVIDEPVAVGPDDRHIARGFQQRASCRLSAVPGLGLRLAETRWQNRSAPPAPDVPQMAHRVDRQMPVDADECGIRHSGQRRQATGTAATPPISARVGMDRPDRPVKPHLPALLDHRPAPGATADNGNGSGPQQPRQVRASALPACHVIVRTLPENRFIDLALDHAILMKRRDFGKRGCRLPGCPRNIRKHATSRPTGADRHRATGLAHGPGQLGRIARQTGRCVPGRDQAGAASPARNCRKAGTGGDRTGLYAGAYRCRASPRPAARAASGHPAR